MEFRLYICCSFDEPDECFAMSYDVTERELSEDQRSAYRHFDIWAIRYLGGKTSELRLMWMLMLYYLLIILGFL